jgi:sRNA-binding protein
MWMKIFGAGMLALALTACESENTNTANENKPAAATPAPATPAATQGPVNSPAAAAMQLKAGDKVKVNVNGSSTDATVVSTDEKAGKVTVKIAGQKENKTVPLSDIVKQ